MAKKLRVELTYEEMASLVNSLPIPGKKAALNVRDGLAAKLLKRPPDRTFLKRVPLTNAVAALGSQEQELMALIIHGISILTGRPEAQIKPGSKLADLGLSDLKQDQLRVYINKYIRDHGGSTFISGSDIAGLKTVQDIFDLAITLIP